MLLKLRPVPRILFGALLPLLICGRRADAPIASAHAADRLDAGAGGGGAAATQCSGPTLAVGDLTLEWQEQEVVRQERFIVRLTA